MVTETRYFNLNGVRHTFGERCAPLCGKACETCGGAVHRQMVYDGDGSRCGGVGACEVCDVDSSTTVLADSSAAEVMPVAETCPVCK